VHTHYLLLVKIPNKKNPAELLWQGWNVHTQKIPTRLATGTTANVERVNIHNYAAILALIHKILLRFEMPNPYQGILRTLACTLTIRMILIWTLYRQGVLLIGK
jgi:hypothetical protein